MGLIDIIYQLLSPTESSAPSLPTSIQSSWQRAEPSLLLSSSSASAIHSYSKASVSFPIQIFCPLPRLVQTFPGSSSPALRPRLLLLAQSLQQESHGGPPQANALQLVLQLVLQAAQPHGGMEQNHCGRTTTGGPDERLPLLFICLPVSRITQRAAVSFRR